MFKKAYPSVIIAVVFFLIGSGVGFIVKASTVRAITYHTYAATIHHSAILVGTGDYSISLNGSDPVTIQNGTLVYRADDEMYYEATTSTRFDLVIFGADIEQGQYAFQEYVCANKYAPEFLGFKEKDEKPETKFSCEDTTKTIVLDSRKVYIFWGNFELHDNKGKEIFASNQQMLVMSPLATMSITATWHYSQGSYISSLPKDYLANACTVALRQNYKSDQITNINLGYILFDC